MPKSASDRSHNIAIKKGYAGLELSGGWEVWTPQFMSTDAHV